MPLFYCIVKMPGRPPLHLTPEEDLEKGPLYVFGSRVTRTLEAPTQAGISADLGL